MKVTEVPGSNTVMHSDAAKVEFRRVMGEYPTGVVLVTAGPAGARVGMACNSFTSVSLDPMLVSLCVAHGSSTWPLIRGHGEFCINVLSGAHEHLARAFSKRDVERFASGSWSQRRTGPALIEAAAWLDCRIYATHTAGDHDIVLAEVVSMDVHPDARPPLVFWRGGYRLAGDTDPDLR